MHIQIYLQIKGGHAINRTQHKQSRMMPLYIEHHRTSPEVIVCIKTADLHRFSSMQYKLSSTSCPMASADYVIYLFVIYMLWLAESKFIYMFLETNDNARACGPFVRCALHLDSRVNNIDCCTRFVYVMFQKLYLGLGSPISFADCHGCVHANIQEACW